MKVNGTCKGCSSVHFTSRGIYMLWKAHVHCIPFFRGFPGIVCETLQCLSDGQWNVTIGIRMHNQHVLFSQVLYWLSEHTDLCTWHLMNTTMSLSVIPMHTSNVSCNLCWPICQPVLGVLTWKDQSDICEVKDKSKKVLLSGVGWGLGSCFTNFTGK